jgi:hypothetical protein
MIKLYQIKYMYIYLSVIVTERFIDHIGSEKIPIRIVQQCGILVNSLTTEPAIWKTQY